MPSKPYVIYDTIKGNLTLNDEHQVMTNQVSINFFSIVLV